MEEQRRGPDEPEGGVPEEDHEYHDEAGERVHARRPAERITGTAASSPDIHKLEKLEASPEAKAHEASDVDAMGQDKRREVIGHSYGPSRRSQIMAFGGFFAVVAVLLIGGKLLADKADEPPDTNPDAAPWSQSSAPQTPAVRPQ